MTIWNGVTPEELPPLNVEVLLSVKWMDVPCVAYLSRSGWIANTEYVEANSGITTSIRDADVEGWMELPKPKWMIERDKEMNI